MLLYISYNNITISNMSSASSMIVDYASWNVEQTRYMPPKVNDRGGSSINIISTQTNRGLAITTPMSLSWGIGEYVDPKTGESDGKFKISIDFREPINEQTETFVEKFKAFEERILTDAVKNSAIWWKKSKSREVLEETFFPSLKYPKNPDTNEPDKMRPPSMRAKIPFWNNKWGVEIYDVNGEQIFPSDDNIGRTPSDFVPSKSQVACVLQCGGIWIGGKGWGVTWKCIQCVVKPFETVSLVGTGKCFLNISNTKQPQQKTITNTEIAQPSVSNNDVIGGVIVEDSDDDEPTPPSKPVVIAALEPPTPEPVSVPEPEPEKEAETVEAEPVIASAPPASAPVVVKKKTVVKKKVT